MPPITVKQMREQAIKASIRRAQSQQPLESNGRKPYHVIPPSMIKGVIMPGTPLGRRLAGGPPGQTSAMQIGQKALSIKCAPIKKIQSSSQTLSNKK